jgi:hypothetical protein
MRKIHDDRIVLGNLAVGPVAAIPASTKFYAQHDTEGSFELGDNGYLKNIGINAAYLEYNHLNGVLLLSTDTHSVTGFRANNTGGVNPTALVEVIAGSNGTAYLNIGATTTRFDFYSNNTGTLAGSFNSTGDWGFGILPNAAAKAWIHSASGQGYGTIISSDNTSPAESILQVRDAASVVRVDVRATGVTQINNVLYVGNSLGSASTTQTLLVKGSDNVFGTINTRWESLDGTRLMELRNNSNLGLGADPLAGDRLRISNIGGYDGAINIGASNLASNGYGILIQGGTAGTNYNGVWSDVTMGGTGAGRSFYGNSSASGYSINYGGYFSGRNGTDNSIGVFGIANGGDSVNPSAFAAGVWGAIGAMQADDRRALHGSIAEAPANNNSLSYGSKVELAWVSGVANEDAWGYHASLTVAGASVTNVAAYLASTGIGAANYALVTNGGFIVFGSTNNINGSLVEVNGDLEIIGRTDGVILEDRTLMTRHRVYLDNGNLLIEAA